VGGLHHPLGCFTRVILQKVAIPSQQALNYKGRSLTIRAGVNGPSPSLCVPLSGFPVEPACRHFLKRVVCQT
jgi:hypothetical protein